LTFLCPYDLSWPFWPSATSCNITHFYAPWVSDVIHNSFYFLLQNINQKRNIHLMRSV